MCLVMEKRFTSFSAFISGYLINSGSSSSFMSVKWFPFTKDVEHNSPSGLGSGFMNSMLCSKTRIFILIIKVHFNPFQCMMIYCDSNSTGVISWTHCTSFFVFPIQTWRKNNKICSVKRNTVGHHTLITVDNL